jgi:hypothetical protein
MLAAIDATACSPEAHCLFTAKMGTVRGKSASNIAIRPIVAPAPSGV